MSSPIEQQWVDPLTGKILNGECDLAPLGTPGAFGRGQFGTHSGLHLECTGTKQISLFAIGAGKVQLVRPLGNATLAVLLCEHQILWPGVEGIRFWSLFAGIEPVTEPMPRSVQAGQLLGTFVQSIHWEIFIEQPPGILCKNPLGALWPQTRWNWSQWEVPLAEIRLWLQGRCEWNGWTAWQEQELRSWCETSHADFSILSASVREEQENKTCWRHFGHLGNGELPNLQTIIHVHPIRFLEQLNYLDGILPHFQTGKYIDGVAWDDLRLLLQMVKRIIVLSQQESSEPLCTKLAQAFRDRSVHPDWNGDCSMQALSLDQFGSQIIPMPWTDIHNQTQLPSSCMQGILRVFLNSPGEPLRPLFHRSSETLEQQPWNTNAVQVPPLLCAGFYFYQTGSGSCLHPNLSFTISVQFIQNLRILKVIVNASKPTKWQQPFRWSLSSPNRKPRQLQTTLPEVQYELPHIVQAETWSIQVEVIHRCKLLQAQKTYQIAPLPIPTISLQEKMIFLYPDDSTAPRFNISFLQSAALNFSLTKGVFVCAEPANMGWHVFQQIAASLRVRISSIPHTSPSDSETLDVWMPQADTWKCWRALVQSEGIDRVQISERASKQQPSPSTSTISSTIQDEGALRVRLKELGYWCSPILRAAIITFQAEFSLPLTGIADENTRNIASTAKIRPGLAVNRILMRKGKPAGKLSGRFFQLNAPSQGEYCRYGELRAIPEGIHDAKLQGIDHNDLWGTASMVQALRKLLLAWHRESGDILTVGDLSLWCGGPIQGHESHQKGCSVDCRSDLVGAPTMYGVNNPKYQVDTTERFCNMAYAAGFHTIYTSCQRLLARIGPKTKHPIVIEMAGHEHHLHLDF